MVKKILITTLLLLFFLSPLPAQAQNFSNDIIDKKYAEDKNGRLRRIAEDDKGIFTVAVENDLFTGTDSGYTNGLRLSYISSEKHAPKLLQQSSSYLPILNKDGIKRVGFALGQNMYTASDITEPNPSNNDFLYAGWLYGTLGLISDSGSIYDIAELTLGVVGPSSRTKQSQKYIHHVIGSPQPQGWNHQIKDEPGVNFSYERKWRGLFAGKSFGVGADVIPHTGASLGNINTSAVMGATFRIGYDLPTDYGPPRIYPTRTGSDFFIPSNKLSGYLFSAFEMRAVARNIFLDGNTFTDSQSLEKRTMIKSIQFGSALIFGDARITYTYVYVTKEFKGQQRESNYGSLTFSYRI